MAMMLDHKSPSSSSCVEGGILLSLDSHKTVPAPFLTKTYQLVDDPTTDHIVSWGEGDSTFVVWRPPEFARDLLPNYFKHNNFSSFVRQLNTYGFRKIVPDRWEFANEFFKKGEKHLLCEIHRRKTSHPPVTVSHHHPHHFPGIGGAGNANANGGCFFAYPTSTRSISPPDSDDHVYSENSSPTTTTVGMLGIFNNTPRGSSVTALSEDNERLRRSNNMLMSELAHMRKLYNDIIYFVQNHVKPVAPSDILTVNNKAVVEDNVHVSRSITKLFGVPLLSSKKRLHPEYGHNSTMVETHKARLVLENDDLGLNLMPPSPC
ncbi:hypothetical protein SSX86_007687 [Deinandra increscens subsp. villosa]|uniref:HSF-type DNA-binding domain-containing protein n=1 Tax=Deinandra increscens subsp. villosa TaxID=3103831 RepID=A0AAP0H3B1_9ASTR